MLDLEGKINELRILFLSFIVYYPEVPMLAQPLEMKIDEELRNNVSSSLANIGTDEKEGKYDTAFEDTKRNTNEEHKTSSSETENWSNLMRHLPTSAQGKFEDWR